MTTIEIIRAVETFFLSVLLSAIAGVGILAMVMLVKECINYFKYKE